jgi:nitrite reductase/ring-hydroxylating ferredoxin subunit
MISMSEDYAKVGRISDFPAGSLRKVVVGNEEVVVGNSGGKLYAIASECSHRGGPLHEGELEGSTVTCPWHGGQFDLLTGKVLGPPPMRDVASFDVRIEGSDVLLKKKQSG